MGRFSSMPASFAKSRKRSESVRWSDMDTTASSGLLTVAYVIGSSRIEELLKNLSRMLAPV